MSPMRSGKVRPPAIPLASRFDVWLNLRAWRGALRWRDGTSIARSTQRPSKKFVVGEREDAKPSDQACGDPTGPIGTSPFLIVQHGLVAGRGMDLDPLAGQPLGLGDLFASHVVARSLVALGRCEIVPHIGVD